MAEPEKLRTRPRTVLEDPSARAIARTYADAFLAAAASVGVENALEEFASFVDDVLATNPEFEAMLLSNVVGRDEKVGIIDRVVAPHGSELFTNFLRVLAKHDRLDVLPVILEESQLGYERSMGRRRVQVTAARDLSDAAREQIQQHLAQAFSFEPILQTHTDARLLGGLVIQVGDTVYDSSLRTRMKRLRGRLHERSLHEIQSGRDRFSHPEGD